jgi:uncharacterized protein DUF4232
MTEHHVMRASVCLVVALTLASCGGGTKTSSTSVTLPPAPTSTTATTPVTTTTTGTVTTTPAGPIPCTASMLALTFIGQQGATGHGELGFALRNVTSHSCRTFGYPGVLFLDRAGSGLPTIPSHTTHDFFGTAPEVPLVINAGASASFRLGVTHGINSTAGCTTADGLQVIPPNDTATLRVTIPEGAYECRTVTVSPLRPGNSAYP